MNVRDLVLKSWQSPGGIVALTAAVRDLALRAPGRFRVALDTSAPYLWDNNPHVFCKEELHTPKVIECHYPLVHSANSNGRHFVTAFHDFLNSELEINIDVTELCGDIHMSTEEVEFPEHLLPGLQGKKPLWLLNAGGKFDFTAKWWPTKFSDAVVNYFGSSINFVQVGSMEHFHPKVDGAIDLRGRTTIRDLIRLVYWADGVVTPVSLLKHLVAAVPRNVTVRDGLRPCVVLAGAREPLNWIAYPGHQVLHNVGMLSCNRDGACWKSRVVPLNDKSPLDDCLCLKPVDGMWAECMTMIRPEQVIQSVESYI